MKGPHRWIRRIIHGGARKRRPVLPLAAAVVLAALTALSVPTTGRSEPAPPQTELGQDAVVSRGSVLLRLPWGSGPGQVGLARPEEGLARGPEAFAVSPSGRLAILDSVNRRVLLLDALGEVLGSPALELGDPRFLAASDEAVFVLEESESRVLGFDWSGNPTFNLTLSPFEEPVTALFLRRERLFVELLHDQVYEIRLKGRGAAGTVRVNGRPADAAGERQAQAAFAPGRPVRIRITDPGGQTTVRELAFPAPVEHLVSLDADGTGRLVLGARLLQDGEPTPSQPDILVARVPGPGEEPGAIRLDEGEPVAFVGEPYRLGVDGRVYQPLAEENGFTILVHELPGSGR